MDKPIIGLQTSQARRSFKSRAGNNNQFVITLLVGTDAVEAGVAEKSAEFSTSWSPKDVKVAARRAREYALKTSLSWIVDLVDSYRHEISRTATWHINEKNVDGAAERLSYLLKNYRHDNLPDGQLVQIGVQWRNAIIHSRAKPGVSSELASAARSNRDFFAREHNGLDIERLIRSVDQDRAPSFKEVTSIIAAAHSVVERLDASYLAELDLAKFADDAIGAHIASSADLNICIAKLWPGSREKTEKRLVSILHQAGMTTVGVDENRLSNEHLDELSGLTAREAKGRFTVVSRG